MENEKYLFVVSGAAGTGKDSVVKALREAHPDTAVREESEFSFPKKTKNPNPSPIEKRFGFSWFGAMEGTRTPGLLIRSQSLYPAELPTHTFRSEQDVFYHAGRGLSTVFCRFFDFIFVFYFSTQKSTSFRFFSILRNSSRGPQVSSVRRSAIRTPVGVAARPP